VSGGFRALLNLGTAARTNAQILHLNGVKEEIALGLRPMRPAVAKLLGRVKIHRQTRAVRVRCWH